MAVESSLWLLWTLPRVIVGLVGLVGLFVSMTFVNCETQSIFFLYRSWVRHSCTFLVVLLGSLLMGVSDAFLAGSIAGEQGYSLISPFLPDGRSFLETIPDRPLLAGIGGLSAVFFLRGLFLMAAWHVVIVPVLVALFLGAEWSVDVFVRLAGRLASGADPGEDDGEDNPYRPPETPGR